MIKVTRIRRRDVLLEYASKVFYRIPKSIYDGARKNPRRTKRIIKCSLALTIAMSLILPPMFAKFLGDNPFLLGTVAIYLFPVKTIGGQLVSAGVGFMGVVFGLAYANLILFLASLAQAENPSGSETDISAGRRLILWWGFFIGALGCGYLRSRIPRSYLAINFFMVVNMFALIRGIDVFSYVFRGFFYAMVFGGCVSILVCMLVWPEDHSEIMKTDALSAMREAQFVMEDIQRSVIMLGSTQEVELAGLKAAQKKVAASLHEANYEISITRVDSSALVPFEVCLNKLLTLSRTFNSAIRRKNKLHQRITRFEDFPGSLRSSDASSTNSSRGSMESNNAATERTSKQIIDEAFSAAVVIFDSMINKTQALYRSGDIKDVPTIDYEKFSATINDLLDSLNSDIQARNVIGARQLEEAGFTDQVHTVLLDILDVVKDSARVIEGIEKHRLTVVLPRKLYAEGEDAQRPAYIQGDDGLVLLRESTTTLDRVGIYISEKILALRRSRHIKYGIKFGVVMGLLSLPAFVSNWFVWYENLRVQWALISAMVAMETTRGMTFRTAGMKFAGALMGGVTAFIVMELSQGIIYVSIALTPFVGFIIGYMFLHPTWAKAGTVYALAYNIILGVATIFPNNGPISASFARRILTLPVGLMVAMLVHLLLFPFRSRLALSKALSASLDWMHHLLYAIEASGEYPQLAAKFDDLAGKASRRVLFAKSLLPATKYEISLAGHWPYERFEAILEQVEDVMVLVVGENLGEPALVRGRIGAMGVEGRLRSKLLASLCNDLLVVSHTLSARLFMPRNDSLSTSVLVEYMDYLAHVNYLENQQEEPAPRRSYSDLGRLADIVNEMSILREQVDELITETQCPKRGLIPQLSFIVKNSRPPTRATGPGTRAATPIEEVEIRDIV